MMKMLLTLKCHLPDKTKAWTTKNIKTEILEQSFELGGISPVKQKHGKHSHTLVNEDK